jgi:sulfate adenylyltransferase large subunit
VTENLKFVIVGHIDHGKSTLIGRLFYDTDSLPAGKMEEIEAYCRNLGKEIEFSYVMDHLQEERDQGITIDTAQIFFKTPRREYTIIDAPGHVEFVKNMITGASQAEAALLIVDAEEGVKEQTRRHAFILSMLGLDQVVVVVNKMDTVKYKEKVFKKVNKALGKFLDEISITPRFIIPISAKEGDTIAERSGNMPWYDGVTVLEALDAFETRRASTDKPLRFPVQDVYKWDKRYIAGRVEAGVIRKGDTIRLLPSEEKTTVASVEEYQKELDQAEAVRSIGITTEDKVFADRGTIIIRDGEDQPEITDTIRANIFWLDKQPMKKGERLLFKCATQETMCEVETFETIIDSSTLEVLRKNADGIANREAGTVTIRTEKPVVIENFNSIKELGRLVLERSDTVAGGIIV